MQLSHTGSEEMLGKLIKFKVVNYIFIVSIRIMQ